MRSVLQITNPSECVEPVMSLLQRRALCWIRRDLRLSDHTALAHATDKFDEVAVVFVFDTEILKYLEDDNDRRVVFIHQSLEELDRKLRQRGSMLIVRHGNPVHEIPQLAHELGCQAVFAGRDYEPYAKERDHGVGMRLRELNIEFHTVKDSVIFEGGEVLSQACMPLRVYTPYGRAWRAMFVPTRHADERPPNLGHLISVDLAHRHSVNWGLEWLGFKPNGLWLGAGEDAGQKRLEGFRTQVSRYSEERDFPAKLGTSGLSVHLRFGTISVRQAVRMALEVGTAGADKWLSELIWREFYQDILHHHPRVVTDTFQPQYNDLEYPGDDTWFEAWKLGNTGFPIIDAAMRCFNATGWMHNRLRMVVASFLTKDLLIDYRRGEAYFARYLLDFDLASNNGGWQWAASVGADPQPYFRIFNPYLQSVKFDPDGDFIKEWVPELALLFGKAVHCPTDASEMELACANVILGETYPRPIVDHSVQREKAIALLGASRAT